MAIDQNRRDSPIENPGWLFLTASRDFDAALPMAV
jgi:hypothetical protein